MFDTDERRGAALDSLISGGCIISGSTVRRSLLFSQVRVNSYCTVEGAVLLPEVTIERKARLTNVIVDRGASSPRAWSVGEDAAADEQRFPPHAGRRHANHPTDARRAVGAGAGGGRESLDFTPTPALPPWVEGVMVS